MKKILMSLFVLGLFAFSFQAHASVLSDALLKIESLTKELANLKADLEAAAAGYGATFGGGTRTTSTTSTSTSSKTTTPKITVLSPNGGESYKAGDKITVKWKSENITSSKNLTIEILNPELNVNNGGGWKTILNSTPNDSFEIITLDKSLVSGKYKIAVKGDNVSDMSDNLFTIKSSSTTENTTTPKITVLSPNGGETWYFGNNYEIKWEVKNFKEPVMIALISPVGTDGNIWCTLGSKIPVSSGKFIFKLKKDFKCEGTTKFVEAGVYQINIYNGVYPFDLLRTGPITIKEANTNPSLTVLSPTSGAKYKIGDKVTVKWKSTGYAVGSKVGLDLGVKNSDGGSSNTFLMQHSNWADDGSEVVTIPDNVPAGNNYVFTLNIYETSTKNQIAKSGVFSIVPAKPYITVISPNSGNEVIESGQKVEIRWSSNLSSSDFVNIYVSDGRHNGSVVKTLNKGDAGLIYTLSSALIPGPNYKVYISSVSNALVKDSSDKPFIIKSLANTRSTATALTTIKYTGGGVNLKLGESKSLTFSEKTFTLKLISLNDDNGQYILSVDGVSKNLAKLLDFTSINDSVILKGLSYTTSQSGTQSLTFKLLSKATVQ